MDCILSLVLDDAQLSVHELTYTLQARLACQEAACQDIQDSGFDLFPLLVMPFILVTDLK